MSGSPCPLRPLTPPLAGVLLALSACYAAWLVGAAPYAPHHILAKLLYIGDPGPDSTFEAFAGLLQVVPFAFLPAAQWSTTRRVVLVTLGAALAAAYSISIARAQWWMYVYTFFAGAGLVVAIFLAREALYGAATERKRLAAYLAGGVLLFIAFGVLTKTYLIHSSAHAAPALDWSVLKLDHAAFGFSPSAWATQFAREHEVLRWTLAVAYETLPLAMMTVFGLELRNSAAMPFGVLKALVVCGFVSAAVYAITPVAGPGYALGAAFPDALDPLLRADPRWLGTPAGMYAPRNAFPSMHWGWALLALLLAARCGTRARAAFGVYALLVALSTVALGEHYLIDLVATFPLLLAVFAVCIERLDWRAPARMQALAAGVAMYLAWAWLVHPGPAAAAAAVPGAVAAWCLLSVAASALLYVRLMRAWKAAGGSRERAWA
jgi:hypothetical protein